MCVSAGRQAGAAGKGRVPSAREGEAARRKVKRVRRYCLVDSLLRRCASSGTSESSVMHTTTAASRCVLFMSPLGEKRRGAKKVRQVSFCCSAHRHPPSGSCGGPRPRTDTPQSRSEHGETHGRLKRFILDWQLTGRLAAPSHRQQRVAWSSAAAPSSAAGRPPAAAQPPAAAPRRPVSRSSSLPACSGFSLRGCSAPRRRTRRKTSRSSPRRRFRRCRIFS